MTLCIRKSTKIKRFVRSYSTVRRREISSKVSPTNVKKSIILESDEMKIVILVVAMGKLNKFDGYTWKSNIQQQNLSEKFCWSFIVVGPFLSLFLLKIYSILVIQPTLGKYTCASMQWGLWKLTSLVQLMVTVEIGTV